MLAPSAPDVATIDTLDPIDTRPESAAPAAIAPPQHEVEPQSRWNLATRIGFRFCFLYVSLYGMVKAVNR